MPAFRLGRISDPVILKSVAPPRLLQFLQLFRSYLESRGFNWPPPDAPLIDYDKLSTILLSPDDGLPSEMVRALLFVDEMSSDDRMDQLLAACAKEKLVLDLGPECTPADVAIQTWLQAPEVLERQHAGVYALLQKNFHYFAGTYGKKRRFPALSNETLQHVTVDLDDCFEAHKRGREAHVMTFRSRSQDMDSRTSGGHVQAGGLDEQSQDLPAVLSSGDLRRPVLRHRQRSACSPRRCELAARPVSEVHWHVCVRRSGVLSSGRVACA